MRYRVTITFMDGIVEVIEDDGQVWIKDDCLHLTRHIWGHEFVHLGSYPLTNIRKYLNEDSASNDTH